LDPRRALTSHNALGYAAAQRLHERLAADVIGGLWPRIRAALPAASSSEDDDLAAVSPIFSGLADHALCYGLAYLAYAASERYTRTMFGSIRISSDEASWQAFTEGILDYAVRATKDEACTGDIARDISDQHNALTRYCASYPPDVSGVLMETAGQIRRTAREVLRGLGPGAKGVENDE
jgi:hypothetical protein